MNDQRLKDLLSFAKTTDLYEMAWETKDAAVHFRRHPATAPSQPEAAGEPATGAAAPAPAPAAPDVIRSTMVGTFYRSDSSERPPLVVEGTSVRAGQPVAAIEAMKIMKDVLAPRSCKVIKVLVDNGHAVEYGQPLFQVEFEADDV